MKSADELICFQEVPDEITLSFSISNCPNNCEGCHSPHLRTDCGRDISAIMPQLLEIYKSDITCVLFFGGDDDKQKPELIQALEYCRGQGLKTALYSGFDTWPVDANLLQKLDYIKIGSYKHNLGGLSSTRTNQRMYKKERGEWKDITSRFWISTHHYENKNDF